MVYLSSRSHGRTVEEYGEGTPIMKPIYAVKAVCTKA
jgi:hypothetical protein